jgi:hypothetical protein
VIPGEFARVVKGGGKIVLQHPADVAGDLHRAAASAVGGRTISRTFTQVQAAGSVVYTRTIIRVPR